MSLVVALRVQKSSLKWLAAILVMAGVGLACLAALGVYSFGSVGDAVAYMKGQRIFARVEVLVSTPTGQERDFDLVVANRGGRTVRILGAQSSCSCLAPAGLPVGLPANGRCTVRVTFRPKRRTGRFMQCSACLRTTRINDNWMSWSIATWRGATRSRKSPRRVLLEVAMLFALKHSARVLALASIASLLVGALMWDGSALGRAALDDFQIEPAVRALGDLPPRAVTTVLLSAVNRSSRPIRVVGMDEVCTRWACVRRKPPVRRSAPWALTSRSVC